MESNPEPFLVWLFQNVGGVIAKITWTGEAEGLCQTCTVLGSIRTLWTSNIDGTEQREVLRKVSVQ